MFLNKILNDTFHVIKQNAPKILFGMGIVGTVSAACIAVKNTPKAYKAIEEKKTELNVEKLPAGEIVKTTWKYYLESAVIEIISISALIISDSKKAKRYSALATAYTGIEKAFAEYREKVVETIGEKKEEKIQKSLHDDELKKIDPSMAIETGHGNTLFWDPYCGRSFLCSEEFINKALLNIGHDILAYDEENLNAFYDYINLDRSKLAENYVWKADEMKKPDIKLRPGSYGPDRYGNPARYLVLDPEPRLDRRLFKY